jgi:hypothetical protein
MKDNIAALINTKNGLITLQNIFFSEPNSKNNIDNTWHVEVENTQRYPSFYLLNSA